MKTYNTYQEAKANAQTTVIDGKTYIQFPAYRDLIDGKDYGQSNPELIIMPAILLG